VVEAVARTEETHAAPNRTAGRRRVAFLNTHPIQYVAPLYAYLNQSPDIEPVALYLTDLSVRGDVDKQFGRTVVWDIDLLAGYEHHFVGSDWKTARPDSFLSLKGSGLWRAIGSGRFDALVLHGHNFLANLVALAAARFHRIPVFYKAETHLLLPRSRTKAALRPLTLKPIFAQMHGFLAISSLNRDFYRALGVRDERIFSFPYTVDNDRYMASSALTPDERRAKRAELGLAEGVPTIVYASKFMPRKHPDDLIRAAQKLARDGVELELLMVGTGEMESELRALAAGEPRLKVVFAGFKNQTELPAVLGACDLFVLPSEDEPFGLIFNEAMCARLPVVASEEIGCVPDLVHSGDNGATFTARDVDGLAEAMRPILADPELRERMGRRSFEIIQGWNYQRNLEGLRSALATVPARGKKG
jgi:glycosyltransferase involved in cell wall biosynthesis